jgi:tetratricopeptide (TPR) repeat protein
MGLLSWLFPSPEDRIAKAKRLLDEEHWADARLEVLDLGHPEAREIVAQAEQELTRANLDAAKSWADADDEYRVAVHMELAESFHKGGMEAEFRTVRRHIRELRAKRTVEEKRKREEKEARLLAVDPLGLSGGGSLFAPPIPEGLDEEDAVELAARLDLLLENYPEDLRGTVGDLGPDFAQAVLDLDDGKPHLALQGLLALSQNSALVAWETARAAYALGDPSAAARTLRKFPDLAPGHRHIGQHHTAVFLAQLLAESGDVPGALRVLRDARTEEPNVGGFLFAQLLASTRELQEAETVLRGLIQKNGRYLPFYSLLAKIRVMGGFRVEAMSALEKAMSLTCGTPGRCGYMPPDPAIVRDLASLYFEDGIETERAMELAEQARGLVQQPGWEDLYLEALVARALKSGDAPQLAERARTALKDGDPRQNRVEKYLS